MGQVGQEREAGLAGLLDEDRDRRLAALLGRHGLLAGVDEEDPEPIDVPLGDPVRRIEGQRRLVVLARLAELAELPERLRQAVLGLGVRAELEQPPVRLGRIGPLGRRRLGDRLVRQLALQPRLVDGARCLGLDVGKGHVGWSPFRCGANPMGRPRRGAGTRSGGQGLVASRDPFVKHGRVPAASSGGCSATARARHRPGRWPPRPRPPRPAMMERDRHDAGSGRRGSGRRGASRGDRRRRRAALDPRRTTRRAEPPDASGAAALRRRPRRRPIVYYEILDAEGSRLMERRLDGQSLARVVAERTDVDYGRTWTVDPSGTIAIAADPGADDQELEAVSIATGAVDLVDPDADRRRRAGRLVGRRPARRALHDRQRGRARADGAPESTRRPAGSGRSSSRTTRSSRGSTADGGLILRQRLPSPQDVNVGWQLPAGRPATASVIERLAGAARCRAGERLVRGRRPGGRARRSTRPSAANDQGTTVRLWTLGGGAAAARSRRSRRSTGSRSTRPGPASRSARRRRRSGSSRFDGRVGRPVQRAPTRSPTSTGRASGDYLAVATDRRGPNLTVVERSTGPVRRAAPSRAQSPSCSLVRVVGGAAAAGLAPAGRRADARRRPPGRPAPTSPASAASCPAGSIGPAADAGRPRRAARPDRGRRDAGRGGDAGDRSRPRRRPRRRRAGAAPPAAAGLAPTSSSGSARPIDSAGWMWDGAHRVAAARAAVATGRTTPSTSRGGPTAGRSPPAPAGRRRDGEFQGIFVIAALRAPGRRPSSRSSASTTGSRAGGRRPSCASGTGSAPRAARAGSRGRPGSGSATAGSSS